MRHFQLDEKGGKLSLTQLAPHSRVWDEEIADYEGDENPRRRALLILFEAVAEDIAEEEN